MLSLVAMWKTSSNHTVQAQRQSVLKNENTIFLRTFYNDFVAASEVICPWPVNSGLFGKNICQKNRYIALKDAVLDPNDIAKVTRLTRPVCGNGNQWGDGSRPEAELEDRCVKPMFIVYSFGDNGVYKCQGNFLDSTSMSENSIDLVAFIASVNNTCKSSSYDGWDLLLPYVKSFSLEMASEGTTGYPELQIDYFVEKKFESDAPPILFRMKRYFVKKRGI